MKLLQGDQLDIDFSEIGFDLDKPQYSICPKCSAQIIQLSSGCKGCGWSQDEKLQGDKFEPAIQKPAARWFGGKWLIGGWISSHFPEHKIYVEPFGGMFSVGLQKSPSEIEIYNDLHEGAYNFWIQLRDRPNDLIPLINQTEFSRETLAWAKSDSKDALNQAHKFYCQCLLLFEGGGGRSSGTSEQRIERAQKHQHAHLWQISDRIQNLTIKNIDAFSIIKEYDSTETLFYIDPCYLPSTRNRGNNYRHDLTENDHVELAKLLNQVKGKVILSGYSSSLYASLYKDWNHFSKQAKTTSRRKNDEYIWLNFPTPGAKEKLSIPCLIKQPHQEPIDGIIIRETPGGVEGRGSKFDVQINDQVITIAKLYVYPKLPAEKKCRTDRDLSPCKKTRRERGEGSGYIEYRSVKRGAKTYEQLYYDYEIWRDGKVIEASRKYIPRKLEAKIIRMNQEKEPVEKILKVLNSKSRRKK